MLGLLGVAAIASSNGDVVAKGILQGFGCAAAGNPKYCSNNSRNDTDEFKWGANYQKVGNMAIGEESKFTRVGNTFLYDRSNGVRYKKIGDTLYGDDGTNCRNVGSLTFCD